MNERETENLGVVQSLFAAFGAGDLPGMLALCADDIEWIVPGPEDVPYFGARRGHEGVRDFVTRLGGSVEFEQFEPREFIVKDERVVVTGRERARVRASGRTFQNLWAMLFTVRDGKVARFISHEDTAAVADAFRG
ncbi:MAG TPA: nuclear transport factor 2 family protein [Pyrinomonadaceae bacterium]|nr:nuclear transport factor 2 family protein [Pyrinomonadaceae bacterium]